MEQGLDDALECRFGTAVPVDGRLEHDETLLRMACHRSHRRFSPAPVPEDVLAPVLACGLSAPSKSDLQQACVVRLRDPVLHHAIADLMPAMSWVRQAPVLLVVCGDNRRIRRICELRGKPFGNDHLDSFFNAAVDAGIVLGTLVQAAEAAGLGCCPLSVIRNRAAEAAELLALPEHVFPVAGIALGYPAGEAPLSPRLPLEVTVHTERYDDAGLEALVDAYDRRRAEVQPIAPEKQRRTELYGVVEGYGWSEDKARQVSVPERADFGAFVRARGFDLA
jgi:nitroreductase/FMN reductase [NAD(P)H]